MHGGRVTQLHEYVYMDLNVSSLLQALLSRPAGHEDCRSNAKPGESQLGRGVLDGFGRGIPKVFESKINIRFRFLGIRFNFGQMLLFGTVRIVMWHDENIVIFVLVWVSNLEAPSQREMAELAYCLC